MKNFPDRYNPQNPAERHDFYRQIFGLASLVAIELSARKVAFDSPPTVQEMGFLPGVDLWVPPSLGAELWKGGWLVASQSRPRPDVIEGFDVRVSGALVLMPSGILAYFAGYQRPMESRTEPLGVVVVDEAYLDEQHSKGEWAGSIKDPIALHGALHQLADRYGVVVPDDATPSS